MSDSEKWAANFDDLTEKQQSLIENFRLKGELMQNKETQNEKPRKKAAVPVVNLEGMHSQCRQIARRLEALQGMAAVYELYPDNVQRQALQQMAAMLHSEIRELVTATMKLELPKTEEAGQ
jgi:hypothetical protein